MRRVMIDFETFGNGKQSCLAQVGACDFYPDGTIGRTFKKNIDAEDSERNGGLIDASTVYWWLAQSEEARASLLPERYSERMTLTELNEFLQGADEIWSHATFDFVILIEALKRHAIKPLFSFKAARDIRTLKALSKADVSKIVRTGTHHDGLADAIFQSQYVAAMLREFEVKA